MTRRTAPGASATPPDATATPVSADTPSPADPRWLLPSVAITTVTLTVYLSLHSRTDPDT